MDLSGLTPAQPCLYCNVYSKIHEDYPINSASYEMSSEVPRCGLHSQYKCHSCDQTIHFNGIAWCDDCKSFTCIKCSPPTITKVEFFVYDYYYSIACHSCDSVNGALDYAETRGAHPYQIGALRPDGMLMVWLPMVEEIKYVPELKSWGNSRLLNMTIDVEFEAVEEKTGDSKIVWDQLAETWTELTRKGDTNHLEIIIPQMLSFIDPQAKIIMDVACGEGTFTRKLAELGMKITGTDVSNLIGFAEKTEMEKSLGITYNKISSHHLIDHYEENSFDQVSCNMALMDMDNLPLVLKNIAYILKPGGQFVFSITHPVFGWPVSRTVKLPKDSQRNEDKGFLVDHYHAEQATKVHMPGFPDPWLFYPRKISTYINELLKHGFSLTGLSEPLPNEETIRRYPRDMYQDYDRNPTFMVFQTKLRI